MQRAIAPRADAPRRSPSGRGRHRSFRNGVGTRDKNLCEAQWLTYVLPCRRFAAALTGDRARLGADVDRYSVIASDLHRLLVVGLPAHCEKFWTLPSRYDLLYLRQFSSRLERKQSEILHESDRIFYEQIGGSTATAIPRRTRRRAVGAARAS